MSDLPPLISSQPASVIAGGVIGALTGLVLAIWILFTCIRRRRTRRQWGYFDQGGGADRSSTPRWFHRLLHDRGGGNDSTSSSNDSFMSPYPDNRADSSADGHRPLQVSHLPHLPPMMPLSGRNDREPVFSIVGIPLGGLSSTSVLSTSNGGVPNGNLGFGRQAERARLYEQEERTPSRSSSPFDDPDPFRSTPPTSLVIHSNSPSAASHETVHALTTDHMGTPQVSMVPMQRVNVSPSETANASTPPSNFAPPAPGISPMRPMTPTLPEPSRVPRLAPMPAPTRAMLPPAAKPTATPSPDKVAQASNALFNSRHRTRAINPFGDSHSTNRSFDSTARSSFISSTASMYSVDDTTTETTDDGVPTVNRRERELHASDLYLTRTRDQRTSRAVSPVCVIALSFISYASGLTHQIFP